METAAAGPPHPLTEGAPRIGVPVQQHRRVPRGVGGGRQRRVRRGARLLPRADLIAVGQKTAARALLDLSPLQRRLGNLRVGRLYLGMKLCSRVGTLPVAPKTSCSTSVVQLSSVLAADAAALRCSKSIASRRTRDVATAAASELLRPASRA